jgi:hypothetical protein
MTTSLYHIKITVIIISHSTNDTHTSGQQAADTRTHTVLIMLTHLDNKMQIPEHTPTSRQQAEDTRTHTKLIIPTHLDNRLQISEYMHTMLIIPTHLDNGLQIPEHTHC